MPTNGYSVRHLKKEAYPLKVMHIDLHWKIMHGYVNNIIDFLSKKFDVIDIKVCLTNKHILQINMKEK